mgnify:CR=1 FL=1
MLADGHWGNALREYMRDYNHWTTIGVLNELLPHPENRITLAVETDPYGIPVARFDFSRSENDKANMAYSTVVIKDILKAAGAQDVLTIQRYAHLVGGGRMGARPEESAALADSFITSPRVPVSCTLPRPLTTLTSISSTSPPADV